MPLNVEKSGEQDKEQSNEWLVDTDRDHFERARKEVTSKRLFLTRRLRGLKSSDFLGVTTHD